MTSEKQPPGGHDDTPLHSSTDPTYTIKITFHRATNLPISDFGSGSADPYILAQANTGRVTRHKEDPPLRYRSPTIRRNTAPTWNASWMIAGIPKSGLTLKTRIYDEDPDDHDDRLGKVEIVTGPISEGWRGLREKEYKVKKTGADFKAYTVRWCSTMVHRKKELHARIVISIELLGRTKEEVGKAYTVNNFYRIHYSPMIGRLAGVKSKNHKGVEQYNFQANEIQLQGPVPNQLYHRYVEFKGFVGGMFEDKGPRGAILNKALHHQHERIYNYNKQTKAGDLPNGPGREMTLQFLDQVHYDQGGRIFTYVITLDGLMRFTETGKEFGIDLLSKHTMHSDVNIYIAWSGEFLVRRLSKPDEDINAPDQHTHPADDVPDGPPHDAPPKEPKYYELVIDNDSGTYRPKADYLPVLHDFLHRNFPGLHILVKNCTDEELDKIKKDQKKIKGKEGDNMVIGQASDAGSISSSEAEDLNERAETGRGKKSLLDRGVEFVEQPAVAVKNMIPGEKGKLERERAETRDDKASV